MKRRFWKCAALVLALVMLLTTLSACGNQKDAEEVNALVDAAVQAALDSAAVHTNVTIEVDGITVTVEAAEGKSIQQLLDEANITLNEGDVLSRNNEHRRVHRTKLQEAGFLALSQPLSEAFIAFAAAIASNKVDFHIVLQVNTKTYIRHYNSLPLLHYLMPVCHSSKDSPVEMYRIFLAGIKARLVSGDPTSRMSSGLHRQKRW